MPVLDRLIRLARWSPISTGVPAPPLSLTADEGTWIKLADFKDHIHVVLLFFRSLYDDRTDAWLKEFQAARQAFEDLETVIFGITTYRPDRLREFRNSLGLEFHLLYDPFALEARKYRSSGRVRPFCKDTVVVVDKQGQVVFSERRRVGAKEVLEQVARLEGKEVPDDVLEPTDQERTFTGVRNPGQRPDEVRHIKPEKAIELLGQADSPYLLVDVRTPSEYEADHVPGAIHIPVDEIPHRYQELGQTTHIILIGQSGGSSSAAAEFLTSIGFSEVYNVEGGMTAWTGDRITGGRAQP